MTMFKRISVIGGRVVRLAAGFGASRQGNVAMIFALVMPVLILLTVGGVDLHRASTVRANLQDSLDAAALAAARSPFVDDEDLTRVGLAALRANLAAYPQVALREDLTTFTLTAGNVVVASSTVDVTALVANIILPPYGQILDDTLPVGAESEVNRSSKNIEVALVLDATGSMNLENRIGDLKTAAKQLVEIVVQPAQEPWYSRVAIVPYSMAVNLHDYAEGVRGAIVPGTGITNITWSTGTVKEVTGASKTNLITITSNGHGFANGDTVAFWGSTKMTQLNARAFTVTNKQNNSFQLTGIDSRNWTKFEGKASVVKCSRTDCRPTVTSDGHGLANDDYVHITGVNGMDQLNNATFQVKNITSSTFQLATVGAKTYTNGGTAWCTVEACEFLSFINVQGARVTQRVSTCITERGGTAAFTDGSPASSRLGRNYPSTSNPCLASEFYPLSDDVGDINAAIDGLTATGSTGGHLGVAWGWYALSPNFAGLFGASAGGAYAPAETIKAVVIMTDGEYNSGYCKGVISSDSTSGSGSTATHINCPSPNGHPYAQTQSLCTNMKAAGVIVYTVGFKVIDTDDARAVVNDCASSADHVYLAETGGDLSEAFEAIGRDITKLRISR